MRLALARAFRAAPSPGFMQEPGDDPMFKPLWGFAFIMMNAEFLYVVSLCCRKLIGQDSGAGPKQKVEQGKKHHGAKYCHDKGGPVPADDEWMAGEQRVGPSTEERPDDADDNVTNTALPRVSAGEDTGDPTRQRSEDDPRNPAQVRDNIHVCLLLCSRILFLAAAEGNRDIVTGDYITAEVKLFSLRQPLNPEPAKSAQLHGH
jgi:hypothetical protein